jgi:hypothetical protein
MPHKVSVPERAFESLRRLAALDEDSQSSLAHALLGVESFTSSSAFVAFLREQLPDIWTSEDLAKLASELLSMSMLLEAHEQTVESAAEAIARADGLELLGEQQDALRVVLELFLSTRAVTNLASAASVYAEHDRLFVDAKLYVDARPVFSLGERDHVGAVLSTILRLNYFSNGSMKEFELALESDNVATLLKALERAQKESQDWADLFMGAGKAVYRFDASED